ncbi:MAG: PAS domain S-box protein [Myxococcales bacterium]|nr:PAS domain S-box protein [Myxococcales bacterium]
MHRILFDNVKFVAWVIDAEGKLLLLEGKGLRDVGLDPARMVGRRVEEFIRPDSAGGRALQRVRGGESFTAVREEYGRISESQYSAVHDEAGRLVACVGVSTDITDRVLAERELERRTAALKRQADLLDLAQDAILTRTADGTITYWNRGAERLYGYTAAEAVGRRAVELLRSESTPSSTEIDALVHATGAWEGELLRTTRDGRRRVVWTRLARHEGEGGEEALILETGTDISERKAELEARIRSEEIIKAQSLAIQELSTPLIPITDEILVMPLVGLMDPARARQVMDALLTGISATRGRVAILDITGIGVVDTQVAEALLNAARAVRLLGAEVILTGIRPEVAQTLVRLETDLGSIVTRATLQDGIRHALGGRPLK